MPSFSRTLASFSWGLALFGCKRSLLHLDVFAVFIPIPQLFYEPSKISLKKSAIQAHMPDLLEHYDIILPNTMDLLGIKVGSKKDAGFCISLVFHEVS